MSDATGSNAKLSDKINDSSSSKRTKKGQKRTRVKQSPEEQYQIESRDRYGKLHHAVSKLLHREAKVVKSFECQKIVRAIKAANGSLNEQTSRKHDEDNQDMIGAKNCSNAAARLQSLQQKLDRTKKMDLDVLVQVGLKRLGVLSLDPRKHDDAANYEDDGKNNVTTKVATVNSVQIKNKSQPENLDPKALSQSQSDDPFYQSLLESMLQHKRLSAALDQLNEKVTEYRQWTTRRWAMLGGDDNRGDNYSGGGNKRKKKKNQQGPSGNDTMVVAGGFNSRKRGLDLGGHEGASGLFIGSLSGMPAEGYHDDGDDNYANGGGAEDEYDGEDYGYQEEKKKNRPGQRARRAKAMAMEARKAGKKWDASINWREKKNDGNDHKEHDMGKRNQGQGGAEEIFKSKIRTGRGGNEIGRAAEPKNGAQIATMGKTWKDEGNAHPSWAAAAAQKSQGIADFQGTKITFD